MKKQDIKLRQLALKIYFLSQEERLFLSAGMDALPDELQFYIDDLDLKFPLLKTLSKSEYKLVCQDVLHTATKNGWELVREKMDLMKENDAVSPVKLYATLFN